MDTDLFTNARAGRKMVSTLENVAWHEQGYWAYTNNGRDYHRITEEQAEQFRADLDFTINN